MTRVPFTHRMLGEIFLKRKTETRRLTPRAAKPGDVMLCSTRFSRPAERAIDPTQLQTLHTWIWMATRHTDPTAMVKQAELCGWRPVPAMLMPQWLCPLGFTIEAVELEAVGAITEAGALAEGFSNRAEFLLYFAQLHPGVPLDTRVQVLKFSSWNIEVAPSAYRPTVTPKDWWPTDWRANLPERLKAQMIVEEVSKCTAT